MKGKYRKGVFVVTYRIKKNKILYLILKRKLHWKGWEFPKGGIKSKENLKKAVKRELYEETGQKPINIKQYPISGKYKYEKQFADRIGFIGQTYKLFSAELKEKKVKFDRLEHSGYKWFSFKKAYKKLTFDNKKKCLKIVNKDLEKTKIL
ncbi:NUDIX domain-containing protein [Candidatus Pacearchaeota archaeon]|nr:NUDIX domain-containing protein [Candidatus Pacearchaeota archaeon]